MLFNQRMAFFGIKQRSIINSHYNRFFARQLFFSKNISLQDFQIMINSSIFCWSSFVAVLPELKNDEKGFSFQNFGCDNKNVIDHPISECVPVTLLVLSIALNHSMDLNGVSQVLINISLFSFTHSPKFFTQTIRYTTIPTNRKKLPS